MKTNYIINLFNFGFALNSDIESISAHMRVRITTICILPAWLLKIEYESGAYWI